MKIIASFGIILFLVGIFWLIVNFVKHKSKKKAVWTLVIGFALVMFASPSSPHKEKDDSVKVAESRTEGNDTVSTDKQQSEESKDTAEGSSTEGNIEDTIRNNVKTAIKNYGGSLVKPIKVNVFNNGDDTYNVMATVHGDILSGSEDSTVAEYNTVERAICKAAYTIPNVNIKVVGLDVVVDTINTKSGGKEQLHAYTIMVRHGNAQKVENWDGVDILSIADPDIKRLAILRQK